MEPIDVYLMYCAMKAHFSKNDYDFITYNGKSRVSRNSFYKRKDRYFLSSFLENMKNPKILRTIWYLILLLSKEVMSQILTMKIMKIGRKEEIISITYSPKKFVHL